MLARDDVQVERYISVLGFCILTTTLHSLQDTREHK